RLTSSPDVPVYCSRLHAKRSRSMSQFNIFHVRFRTGSGKIVPVTVQNTFIRQQGYSSKRSFPIRKPKIPIHPEIVFLLHMRKVFSKNIGTIYFSKKPHHQGKKGRLRTC